MKLSKLTPYDIEMVSLIYDSCFLLSDPKECTAAEKDRMLGRMMIGGKLLMYSNGADSLLKDIKESFKTSGGSDHRLGSLWDYNSKLLIAKEFKSGDVRFIFNLNKTRPSNRTLDEVESSKMIFQEALDVYFRDRK